MLVCLVPNDKDARLKMSECEKLIRKIEFLKAIEQGDPPSAAEGLDLNAMGSFCIPAECFGALGC
jgi:hypothetical protein